MIDHASPATRPMTIISADVPRDETDPTYLAHDFARAIDHLSTAQKEQFFDGPNHNIIRSGGDLA